jgi:hypothetical protein
MESANYILQQPGFPLIWTALAFNRPGRAGTFYDLWSRLRFGAERILAPSSSNGPGRTEKKEPKEPKALEVTLSYLCLSRPRYGLVLIPS